MKLSRGRCRTQRPVLISAERNHSFSAEQTPHGWRLRWSEENFNEQEQSGILAQIFSILRKSSAALSGTLRFKTLKKNSVKYRLYNCRADCAERATRRKVQPAGLPARCRSFILSVPLCGRTFIS